MSAVKRVLFVCVENANRSQMAEAFAPIAGGFLLCMAVPIIRMFAGWIGINL